MMTLELSKLSNALLHSKLLDLAAESRCNEAFMLRFLSEVDDRKLYLDKGCPSLFEYCRVELRVSESSAWRLIASARAAQRHPQIYELLAAGTIHSTAVAMIASSLKDESKAAERLSLACGKSKRELEVMIAGWSAKPVAKVKDSIRAVAHSDAAPEGAQGATLKFEPAAGTVSGEAEARPRATPAANPAKTAAVERRRMVIRFEASGELVDLIDRAKEVLAHLDRDHSLATLFGEALEALLDKRDPIRVAARAEARREKKGAERKKKKEAETAKQEKGGEGQQQMRGEAQPQAQEPAVEFAVAAELAEASPPPVKPAATVTRYIPAGVRGAVTAQSGGRCEYVSAEGRRCGARSCLEVDHIEPFALGGRSELGNLRHLCAAHNRWRAAQTFGCRDKH